MHAKINIIILNKISLLGAFRMDVGETLPLETSLIKDDPSDLILFTLNDRFISLSIFLLM